MELEVLANIAGILAFFVSVISLIKSHQNSTSINRINKFQIGEGNQVVSGDNNTVAGKNITQK